MAESWSWTGRTARPVQPERELAGILTDLAMEISTEAAVAGYAAYRASDGPATLADPADFSTAISVQSRLLRFYGERAVAPEETAENRQRSDRRMRTLLSRPLTPSSLKALLTALHADRLRPALAAVPRFGRHFRS